MLSKTIHLISSQNFILETLSQVIRSYQPQHFEVEIGIDDLLAPEKVEKERLILWDILEKQKGGVLREIKDVKNDHRDIKIVILQGPQKEERTPPFFDAGVDAILSRIVKASIIMEVVKKVFEGQTGFLILNDQDFLVQES